MNRQMILGLKQLFVGGLASVAFASLGVSAQGADLEQRTVTLVVPWSAGGPVDAGARIVAFQMQQTLGVSVVVDNRTGASGIIGAQFAAQAKPDGHTVLVGNAAGVAAPYNEVIGAPVRAKERRMGVRA